MSGGMSWHTLVVGDDGDARGCQVRAPEAVRVGGQLQVGCVAPRRRLHQLHAGAAQLLAGGSCVAGSRSLSGEVSRPACVRLGAPQLGAVRWGGGRQGADSAGLRPAAR
jgi:hypothetical protein